MPPPQIFSLDGHAYGLTVSGVQVIDYVPLDLAPIRWEMPSEATTGGISFTVEDTGQLSLPAGAVVRWTDNVNNELLASGVLVNRRYSRGIGPLRMVECDVAGPGYYLDHRQAPAWTWAAPPMVSPVFYDSQVVTEFVNTYGGPVMASTAVSATSTATGTAFSTGAGSLRAGLQAIATWADIDAFTETRSPARFYVDSEWQLHYFQGTEGTAPYTISNVEGTANVVPDSIVMEYGSDAVVHSVYASSADGTALGLVTAETPSWDAGQVIENWSSTWAYDSYADLGIFADNTSAMRAEARAYIRSRNTITSATFTTQEYGGWKPHQAIVINDAMLTGGEDVVQYIAAVSGQTVNSNAIEYRVTTGAVARSLVQTVATP